MPPPREPRLSHDRRILLMALASALPGAMISLIFLWSGDYTPKVQWTLTVVIVTVAHHIASPKDPNSGLTERSAL